MLLIKYDIVDCKVNTEARNINSREEAFCFDCGSKLTYGASYDESTELKDGCLVHCYSCDNCDVGYDIVE